MLSRYCFIWRYRSVLASFLAVGLFFLLTSVAAFADDPSLSVGVPTRLVIPALALDSPVVAVGRKQVVINGRLYTQWETSDDSVAWNNLSAKLGHPGNTVLSGHSDVYAKVFQNLKDVKIGDGIVVLSGQQFYYYFVTQKFLVREKDVPIEKRLANARWISRTNDERLTLVTCALPGATHRLIVIARPAIVLKR